MVRAQTVYAVGGYAIPDFASPDPIGSSTPNSGVFTTLSASGTVSGTGFSNYLGAPPPIGNATPNTGAFTAFSATSGAISGNVVVTNGRITSTDSTADNDGPVTTNTSTDPAALSGYTAYNHISDYLVAGVLSANYVLNGAFGPGYGVVFSLNKLTLSSSANGVFINVNGGTHVGSFTSTGLAVTGTVKSTAGTGTAEPVMVGTLSVNTTAVGNVGAGTDDLMSYALPANSLSANGKGVRVTMWGTAANNANAKTLDFYFGGLRAASILLTVSTVRAWQVVATVMRSGASAQEYSIATIDGNASTGIGVANAFVGSTTQTDTAGITIKGVGTATADNDIVQKGMIVEFIS